MWKSLLLTLPFLLITSGCAEELEELTTIDETRYRASFAFPIIDSGLGLDELIDDADGLVSLTVDPDGLIVFRYSGEIPAVPSDLIFERLEPLAQGIFLPITTTRQALPFGQPEGLDLDLFRTKSGQLRYNLPNRYPEAVTVELTLPITDDNDDPIVFTGNLPAYSGEGTPPTLSNPATPLELNGYEIAVEGDSVFLDYRVFDANGNLLAPSSGTVVTIEGLRFSYVEGYLGKQLYPGVADTIVVDFFEDYLSGRVDFVDPTITVTVRNSFGVPARAVVEVLDIISVDGSVLPVSGTAVAEGFDFAFPESEGETATTTFVFDKSNTNVSEILSSQPAAVAYSFAALLNAEEDVSRVGFVTDTSSYSATIDVALPLFGTARNFTVSDTFELELGERYDDIEDILFRLTTFNELPLDVAFQGFFLNDDGDVLATLTPAEFLVLTSAPVGPDGNPTAASRASEDFVFEGERVSAIRAATRLAIQASVATTAAGTIPVRVTTQQQVTVKLGAIVTVNNQ